VTRELFTLNPRLDRKRLAEQFAADGRIQVRDFLTGSAALEIRDILARMTPWEIAWQAGDDGPNAVNAAQVRDQREAVTKKTAEAAAQGEYAFQYARYPMLEAYLEKRAPDGPHDLLLEHINSEDFLSFIRDVTGIPSIRKGDAQATLYAPGHFLGRHIDSHVAEGWRVAYVMNFCIEDWKPDWGGYLNFFDDDGDVLAGYRPRFNALNMFTVPRPHAVAYVPPFAPVGRFAITGWFRDR
jgi:Rps23 Pro-64 3,4-dihydroxylase Tpa1-like proline 4-hydroxylase